MNGSAEQCRDARILEVGAGDSLIADILAERSVPFALLTVTDASEKMLGHSGPWAKANVNLRVCSMGGARSQIEASILSYRASVTRITLRHSGVKPGEYCSLVVGSCSQRPPMNGHWHFAKPCNTPVWIAAEFERRDGNIICVPSLILSTKGPRPHCCTILDFSCCKSVVCLFATSTVVTSRRNSSLVIPPMF